MDAKRAFYSITRGMLAFAILGAMLQGSSRAAQAATQFDIHGPAGSVSFGTSVTVLPNGNIVVTDPNYNGGIGENVGAVYLYNGNSGAMISMLTGLQAGDFVGLEGVTVLSNGNYVVRSPYWKNGGLIDAGALTWGSKISGISGVVSVDNSLVGGSAGDGVGRQEVTVLSNGNYVVSSYTWDNGGLIDAGAVTWGNGTIGTSGIVSATNSLVGSTASDYIGYEGVVALSNGNYVVKSPYSTNGGVAYTGAVTWGSGTSGVKGTISAINSLVGSTANDWIGSEDMTVLKNGNYLVISPGWDNGGILNAGAVTWGNGTSGVTGTVTVTNSLVGGTALDKIGNDGVYELTNGNYVVLSPEWHNSGLVSAGAVTWGNGTSGVKGMVTPANSLVGSSANDQVGSDEVILLSNGNYVVRSPTWNIGGIVDAGAVTWGDGTSGVSGAVSTTNSLVGSHSNDRVGIYVVALSSGNYVVGSYLWDKGGISDAGAVTWRNGTSPTSGAVSEANSLVGSTTSDRVGSWDVIALTNGNYVVCSNHWQNSGITDAGAVTWGSGTSGIGGIVSASNSLVGSTANDRIGNDAVTALTNGNYVVVNPNWDNGGIVDAGAATWGSGANGVSGTISVTNSLVGSTASDQVGYYDTIALNNGSYIVRIPYWDNGGVVDAGAVAWGNGTGSATGVVSTTNSLVGSTNNDRLGLLDVTALSNGNYVVTSPNWDNVGIVDAGAVTWGSGTSGLSGAITAANSLVGSTAYDLVGSGEVAGLSNGSYAVASREWDNVGTYNAGAVTWGFGSRGAFGSISSANSVLGLAESGGFYMVYQYDAVNRQLVVGRPADNIVTLFKLPYVFLPVVRK